MNFKLNELSTSQPLYILYVVPMPWSDTVLQLVNLDRAEFNRAYSQGDKKLKQAFFNHRMCSLFLSLKKTLKSGYTMQE
jgi:hypothetical protein